MNYSVTDDNEWWVVRSRHLEAVKWFAASFMLVEHWFRYVVGELPVWSYAMGRTVFPLFCLALGAAVRLGGVAVVDRIFRRLEIWFVVASVLGWLVRDWLPLNVLGTLWLCLVFVEGCRRRLWWLCAFLLVLSLLFEFGPLGVLGGAALMWQQREERGSFVLLVLGLLLVGWANMNLWVVIVLPVLVGVRVIDLELPRWRHGFYWVYAGQFPLFALWRALV